MRANSPLIAARKSLSAFRAAAIAAAFTAAAGLASAQAPPPSNFAPSAISTRAHDYLVAGNAQVALSEFSAELEKNPNDADLRFATGIMQAIVGFEKLGQSWFVMMNPKPIWTGGMLRSYPSPVPPNESPEIATHADVRAALGSFLRDIENAEKILAPLEGREVKLELDLTGAHFDFDGDMKASPTEEITTMFDRMNGRSMRAADSRSPDLRVRLDTGDVAWLRGRCHIIAGMLELQLAYDDKVLFDQLGHNLFHVPDSPYAGIGGKDQSWREAADFIYAIHLTRLPLIDKSGPPRARQHFKEAIRMSRAGWIAYGSETDNDLEWIPNPEQVGVTGAAFSPEMLDGWGKILDEFDAILDGKVLVPHWAVRDGRGVNVMKVFEEPRDFDLVGWVHGNSTVPYLENGTKYEPANWSYILNAPGAHNGWVIYWML